MDQLVLRHDHKGAATLTLNRPDKLNALTIALFQELDDQVTALATQIDQVGVVIVRGAGSAFSAGHDLSDIATGESLPRPNFQASVIERLSNLPQPVISAVQGHCYTGGLELALAADLIVAGESARFADTHAKWSLTPIWGMSQRLPRRIGTHKAREMMFTCQTYNGRQAEQMGLADRCVPDDQFDQALNDLVSQMLAQSWFSHRANKRLLRETDGMALASGLAHEVFRSEGRGPDMHERIAAFKNRAPRAR